MAHHISIAMLHELLTGEYASAKEVAPDVFAQYEDRRQNAAVQGRANEGKRTHMQPTAKALTFMCRLDMDNWDKNGEPQVANFDQLASFKGRLVRRKTKYQKKFKHGAHTS